MTSWQEETDRRNGQALARLSKSLPAIFPPAVLARAHSRPFIPPTPRLAIDSYWRAHPIRAGHQMLGISLQTGGDITGGRAHYDQAIALYEPVAHRPLATRFGQDSLDARAQF